MADSQAPKIENWLNTCTWYNWRISTRPALASDRWYIITVQREDGLRTAPFMFEWIESEQVFQVLYFPQYKVPLAAVGLFAVVPILLTPERVEG